MTENGQVNYAGAPRPAPRWRRALITYGLVFVAGFAAAFWATNPGGPLPAEIVPASSEGAIAIQLLPASVPPDSRNTTQAMLTNVRKLLLQGQPLGALDVPLKSQFGARHAEAVNVIVSSSGKPVPIAQLIGDLDKLESQFRGRDPEASFVGGLSQFFSTLVIFRDEKTQSPLSHAPLARARMLLEFGQPGAAAQAVSTMPGASLAGPKAWSARASQLDQALAAVTMLEQNPPPAPAPLLPAQ